MKSGTLLSLLANLVLVVLLLIQSKNTKQKVADAIELTASSYAAECSRVVATAATVGYINGCMSLAIGSDMSEHDPLFSLILEHCIQGAKTMSESVELKQ